MAVINYKNDATRATEEAEGSDGRLNVSSRSDSRGYYNSRGVKQSYSVPFEHDAAASGEYAAYWQNTSVTGDELVISAVGLNSSENSRMKLWFVTGTAAGGNSVTPTNLNKQSNNDASSKSRESNGGDAISGLSEDGLIDYVYVTKAGHEELRLDDRVRLGQNDAIALEYDQGAPADVGGVIFGYFE